MTSQEDMDPAYAESMAGQFELLGHALRRFLKATYAELGKILDPQTSVEDGGSDSDRLRSSSDRVAPVSGSVRFRSRCAAGEGECIDWPEEHYHIVEVNGDNLFDLADNHRKFLDRTDQPERSSLREPDKPTEVNCARGESCPAYKECRCSCEHFHNVHGTGFSIPYSRNRGSSSAGALGADFYCTEHGYRVNRLEP